MATTAADSEVIKEFLISLGFKIDEAGMKKFANTLTNSTKGAMGVGAALIGAAFAVEKFVERIADGMEKLFYMSQRTGASVTNLKAMEGAFQSAGFAAGKSSEFIETFAENLRANPGMAAFVENTFGLDTAMDKADLFMATMHKLADMAKRGPGQYAIAAQQANMIFGMSDKDFKTAIENLDKIDKIEQDRKALLKESGVDMEKLSKESVEFNNNLRAMGADLGAIGTQFADVLMPAVNGALHGIEWFLHQSVKGMAGITSATKEDFLSALAATSEGATPEMLDKLRAAKSSLSDEDIIANIEKQHGLVSGIMSAVREVESSGGKNLVGPAVNGQQAFGPFQISNSNFAALGLSQETAMDTAKSGEAWAQMFDRNLKEFQGDYLKAIAATNSNPAHVREAVKMYGKDWIAGMNAPTQDYLRNVDAALGRIRAGGDRTGPAKNPDGTQSSNAANSVSITQNNTYNINGNDADANGKAVAEHNKRKLGDATRDARGLMATPGRS